MENNNDNNKNRGIFYGVMGVATLVITLIGATFAYFTASINTKSNAVYTQAANITLQITEDFSGLKTGIVPVDEFTLHDAFATGGYVGSNTSTLASADNNCIDVDGNPFCSVYTFTITNPSTAAQTVYARMDVEYNTFASNTATSGSGNTATCNYLGFSESAGVNSTRTLTDTGTFKGASATYTTDKTGERVYCGNSNIAFAIYKGTPTHVLATTNKWEVLKAVTTPYTSVASGESGYNATTDGNTLGTSVIGGLGDLVVSRTAVPAGSGARFEFDALTQTLKSGGSVTYTVLVWLHETWQDQQADEGQQFGAGITFSTSQGGSGVTTRLTMN